MIRRIRRQTLIAAILIVALSAAYYFVIFLPKSNIATNTDTVGNTLKCNELYELKKSKYWGEKIGQNKAIYNADLNTCLAMNMHNDFSTSEFYAMVMDMSDDSTLMYYNSTPKGFYFEDEDYQKITCEYQYDYFKFVQNGKEHKEYGCEKWDLLDKMLEQVRSYGFIVLDWFSSE